MDGKEITQKYLSFIRNKWRDEARSKEYRGELSVAAELNRRANALNAEMDRLNREWDGFLESLKKEEDF